MATKLTFTVEEMVIDEGLGYPKAYAKLCRDPYLNQYRNGPPFSFIPYSSQPQEVVRAKDLDEMFPIIDTEAKPSTKPRVYASLLWKQLNHLGNAGFDPAKFRVDPYGNVLYYYADSASPLAWEIDHWFPCSRGGRTVPSNLRLLQWQVCIKKQNKLEFLVPWWDLQLGISVNQFLSVFASSNSDFRNRAFSLLFYDGENEELNSKQTVESHTFPSHFLETKQKVGLAPAAIVSCRKESSDASSVLRSIDVNRRLRSSSPVTGCSRKYLNDENQSFRPSFSKENDNNNTNVGTNPYLTIAMARDSLRHKEEMQAEIQRLDDELVEIKQKNEVERVALQDLELVLIKRRRRAEKSRRLAEAQASYKSLLEKMIRDAMHQSVVYKEQARLNQAAASALMARLEAQKAICDSSEKDLHRKLKQRDEIENQIRPHWARKRSRIDDALFEDREDKSVLYLPGIKTVKLQKELREFLAEEQKASEAGLSPIEERESHDGLVHIYSENPQEHNKSLIVLEHETPIEDMLQKLEIQEEKKKVRSTASSVFQSPAREEEEDDEECRNQRGKGNVEKWLQMLLDDDDNKEGVSVDSQHQNMNEDERNNGIMNPKNTLKDIKIPKFPTMEEKTVPKQESEKIESSEIVEERDEEVVVLVVERKDDDKLVYDRNNTSEEVCSIRSRGGIIGRSGRKSFDVKVRKEKNGNERGGLLLVRCESARTAFRPIPYSPSTILRMKKGVDCIGKKPVVIGSDEEDDDKENNNIIKSTTFKKAAVKKI